MARPTARVLALLELLQSGGVRPVPELAARLGVDERTVRRYVQHLLELDVPVVSVRGRHGGYRLAPGYRMPPLMLNDDEALAVLLGLIAGRRVGLMPGADVASETAAAKIRRVLPTRLGRALDALLDTLAITTPQAARGGAAGRPRGPAAPRSTVLLPLADAARHHRPVAIRYVAADGHSSERTLHPYGLVAHAGNWYVTGADPAIGADRTFRVDRVQDARTLPGSFTPPSGVDPVERVLSALAGAPYRHEVTLRVQGPVERIRAGLPASLATLTELTPGGGVSEPPWFRAELRVERLDWLPAVLAGLDLPFVIERPDALRGLVAALAARLAHAAEPPGDAGRDTSRATRNPDA
ncbi:helix-turn-helix transcriptional regulator [Streptomyces sp. NPDC048111]|uniref:helix-turn-helix transcriptional regulator n=1 Tax=Streptomyces sp. NPDC048111 TaxID=3365500 RepID=UPI00371D07A6